MRTPFRTGQGSALKAPRQPVATARKSPAQLNRAVLRCTLALGRVVVEPCLHYILIAPHFLALLPAAAADRTLLFNAQRGDAATGAGNRLAPHQHADGHAQHYQQHGQEDRQPDHGSTPAPKRRLKTEVPRVAKPWSVWVTKNAAMPARSAWAKPRSGPSTISRVDNPSARSAEGPSTVTAASR